MKALFGCEESQAVTMAFREQGHEAYSCDLQECSGGHPEWHFKDSIFHVLCRSEFSLSLDFFGAHPPCQFLANSGVRWLASVKPKEGFEWSDKYQIYINPDRFEKMEDAALFFKSLLANIERIGMGYIENPILHKYAMEIIGVKPTQIIQPWQFGHGETKATCLWLVGIPKLIPTNIVDGREARIHRMAPSPERTKERSKTYIGIASAMASQWGRPQAKQSVLIGQG